MRSAPLGRGCTGLATLAQADMPGLGGGVGAPSWATAGAAQCCRIGAGGRSSADARLPASEGLDAAPQLYYDNAS